MNSLKNFLLKNISRDNKFLINVTDIIGENLRLALKAKMKHGRKFPRKFIRNDIENVVKAGLLEHINYKYKDEYEVNSKQYAKINGIGIESNADLVITIGNTLYLCKISYVQSSYTRAVNTQIEEEVKLELNIHRHIRDLLPKRFDLKMVNIRVLKNGSNRRKSIVPYIDFQEIDYMDVTEFLDVKTKFTMDVLDDKIKLEDIDQCSDLHFNGSAFSYPMPMKCIEECDYSTNCPKFKLSKWQIDKINEEFNPPRVFKRRTISSIKQDIQKNEEIDNEKF